MEKVSPSNRIKILMVLGSLKFGGAEILCLSILESVDREKYDISFAVTERTDSEIEKKVLSLGAKVYLVPRFKVLNYSKYVSSWNKLLSENKFDIVHGHAIGAIAIYLKIAKKHGCTTISHSHSGSFTGNFFVRHAKRFFSRKVCKVSDCLVACSKKAAENVYGKGAKYVFVPNGIKTDNFFFDSSKRIEVRNSLNLKDNDILFGHVGRFITPKNQFFLLEIFKKIVGTNKNSYLLLCGDGPLKKRLMEYCKKLDIESNVIFIPTTSKVFDYLFAMDLFVLPSLFEGLPITVVEAQAAGLAVMCSDNITKEVKITDGVKFLPLSSGAGFWANECIKQSAIKRNRVEDNKLVTKSNFTNGNLINSVVSIYEEVLKN